MSTPVPDTLPTFERVLLATDFSVASQAAFRTALEKCHSLNAGLTILHVFEYAEMAPPESGGLLLEMQGLRENCQEGLEELRKEACAAGIPCQTLLEDGIASTRILEEIRKNNIDLAVLGTNALHGFERLIFGSTAETVLRKASCPVLTVGPRVFTADDGAFAGNGTSANGHKPDGPIVFATDFDFTTMHAIRFAAFFSNLNNAPLHCLHVLPRTFEGRTQCAIVPPLMSEALHQLANESGVVIVPPTCATTFGSEVSWAVVDYARKHHARLIVLGVRQASLLASHVPEHITYRIITEASCPVLTMAFASHSTTVHSASSRGGKNSTARHEM